MNIQGKVWGLTQHLFAHNDVSIHRIEIKAGGFCSKHKHVHKWNAFYIEVGELEIDVWKNDYDLIDKTVIKTGEMAKVPPGEFHKFKNNSDKECIAYEIYWSELDESDIVREDVGGTA